jgi:hypothetical protein
VSSGGKLPERATTVSWIFNKARCTQHLESIRFLLEWFDFFGVGMPDEANAVMRGRARQCNF